MSLNGISGLSTKQLKQNDKLRIVEAKRRGKNVAGDGTITGSVDSTKPYYRGAGILDKSLLATVYTGNTVTIQTHSSGLVPGRPWVDGGGGAVSAPSGNYITITPTAF